MPGDLAHRIARTDPRLLLPSGSTAPDRLRLVDAWQLPAGGPSLTLVLLHDAEGHTYAAPLVDDVGGLRRAREGDGWATAVVEFVAAGPVVGTNTGTRFEVRMTPGAVVPELPSAVSEMTLEASVAQETTVVGGVVRVRFDLLPSEASGTPFNAVAHLLATGFDELVPSVGDVIWRSGQRWVAPLIGVAWPSNGMPLDEAFGRTAARHLRGGADPRPTLELAANMARLLARLHVSIATPSTEIPVPVRRATAEEATAMARSARDAVAEAVVLTDIDTQEHVRARRHSMRSAFEQLGQAVGSPLIPAVPFVSLTQAIMDNDRLLLDPLQLTSAGRPRVPAADVASLLRTLNHVAHGALRRLVGGGESVAVERVSTWAQAVRQTILDEYRQGLAEAGRSSLFDEGLLLGLEIAAECHALSFAARNLSTWATVPDAGLLELLPPD